MSNDFLEFNADAANTYRRKAGECAFCDKYRNDKMMPSHTPSEQCESGKRPHCTCELCF